MYMGLTMTSASTYQMLRGSVVIFTGLMSRVMFARATAVHQVSTSASKFGTLLSSASSSHESQIRPNPNPSPNPGPNPGPNPNPNPGPGQVWSSSRYSRPKVPRTDCALPCAACET